MQAFEAAWAEACKVEASTMLIPADYVFYVGPISFSGPYCKPNIIFQVIYLFRVYLKKVVYFFEKIKLIIILKEN